MKWLDLAQTWAEVGPAKCHNFTRYVGRMNMSGVGKILATTILLSRFGRLTKILGVDPRADHKKAKGAKLHIPPGL